MTKRMILIGTGGFGAAWCESFLPPNIKDKTVQVVAAVDPNGAALANAQKRLHLKAEQCFSDAREALRQTQADFVAIVTPPHTREKLVELALAHGLDILSEKPISEDLRTAARIAHKVRKAKRKMAVTMSHRFAQDKLSLKRELASPRHGRLDYIVCRLTCPWRGWSGSGWRDRMVDFVLQDCAVHHLDILADMAGAPCEELYAESWTKPWSGFKSNTQCLVTMRAKNGVRVLCEFGLSNAVSVGGWGQEYFRAECEHSTLVLNHRRLECFRRSARGAENVREGTGKEIKLLKGRKWSNALLIEQFVKWISGGPKMPTNVEANLQSMALVEAALLSNRKKRAVKVQELLNSQCQIQN